MRDIVKRAISQFLAHEFPTDEDYYQKNQEVASLVETLKQLTKRKVTWEAPIDMFNFYHLQFPVDFNLNAPLYGKKFDQLEQLVD